MPTKIGTIWANSVGFRTAHDTTDDHTINFAGPRDITATYTLSFVTVWSTFSRQEDFLARAGIKRIVQNGQVKEWSGGTPRIREYNVTSITFRLAATDDCTAGAAWNILFWE